MEVAPYLFGHMMSQFSEGGMVLKSGAMALQLQSYNKVWIGLSHTVEQHFLEASPDSALLYSI